MKVRSAIPLLTLVLAWPRALPAQERTWDDTVDKAVAYFRKTQAKDGSWTNRVELVRENDPIVATSSAVLALSRCGK